MSLVLDTGTMKYRQNPNQSWRPLVIKAGMNWESMADTYDPDNGTYEVGQYVLEEGMMYRCISEITTPEAWTPAHWTSVNVGDELSSFIIISDDQPTDETNKIWIAETTTPFGVQVPTMDDHNALGNTLSQLETNVGKILPVITGSTNNSGYTIATGDYFEANGALYKATAYIPQGNAWSTSATALNDPAINNLRAEVATLSEYNGIPIKRATVSILAGTAAADSWTVIGNIPSDVTGIILSVTICLAGGYSYFNIPMYIRSGEFAIYNLLGGPIQFSNGSYLVIDYI